MCGRFTLATPAERIAEHFQLASVPVLAPHYNIAPSQSIAAIRAAGPQRELVWLRWGLVPAWAKDPNIGYKMINARAESLAERPAYRTAFRRRRCLVPADGFYEWKGTGRGKQPYHIRRRDRGPFAIAGLWEHWKSPAGDIIESVTLVTTAANALLAPVHDRMPVLLAPESYGSWLDPAMQEPKHLTALLQPCSGDELVVQPVSARVNNTREDDAALIEGEKEPNRSA